MLAYMSIVRKFKIFFRKVIYLMIKNYIALSKIYILCVCMCKEGEENMEKMNLRKNQGIT